MRLPSLSRRSQKSNLAPEKMAPHETLSVRNPLLACTRTGMLPHEASGPTRRDRLIGHSSARALNTRASLAMERWAHKRPKAVVLWSTLAVARRGHAGLGVGMLARMLDDVVERPSVFTGKHHHIRAHGLDLRRVIG